MANTLKYIIPALKLQPGYQIKHDKTMKVVASACRDCGSSWMKVTFTDGSVCQEWGVKRMVTVENSIVTITPIV